MYQRNREKDYQDKITEVQDNNLHRKYFYTQNLLHTDVFFTDKHFLHRSFYTQKLLHTKAFTHKGFYTGAFTDRHFYTQRRLHTDTFNKQPAFFTQELLHTEAFARKRRIDQYFLCERITPEQLRRNFTAVFAHHPYLVRKGFSNTKKKIYLSFCAPNIISCERGCSSRN
jgi:hypothetical protein